MTEGSPAGVPRPVERLIGHIAAAINARSLYAAGHPAVAASIERLIESVEAACADRKKDALTFLVVGGELIVENQPLRKGGLHHQQLIRLLARRGVERLTIARGVTPAECLDFLTPMVVGGIPQSSEHIVVGRVEVRTAGGAATISAGALPSAAHPVDASGVETLSSESVDHAREAFGEFRSDRRAGLWRLEEIVWSLMEALSSATREVLPLAPLKTHDDYTFVHSVNVSLLTLAQARSFGFAGEALHAIGVAALLHDVGKLRIPLEVLNKPGKLEGEEWTIMKSHAEVGALHLCGIEGSYPLAIVVAYEHHMRYDGKPNYPVTTVPRKPTLASQMTAISDVFDAICTIRPYHKARGRAVALGIIRERVGTFHHPALVANFARMIGSEEPEVTPEPA
jgi:HD-GYP domain-containing protein (c-di-GMP phosphodiesterase class II)